VHFAIDKILALNADEKSPLHARVDAARIGMAGHSFGGWTTLAVAGEKMPSAGETLAEPRIRAAIAMSPPIPARREERDTVFATIKIPIFEMTGTLDDSPIGETKAAERRIAFDKINSPGSCLVIFKDADHMTFAQHLLPRQHAQDEHFHALICDASTAFWDGHLRENKAALDWLERGGFAKTLDGDGTFEIKNP